LLLLAFPRDGGGEPVHVLIDCGYKPGSPQFIRDGDEAKVDAIINHIAESTGQHLDLVVATHEHQDHLNGIWRKTNPYFKDFQIDEAWFAWTEDPADDLANDLRKKHRDRLLGLVQARNQLALALGPADKHSLKRLDSLLNFELGGDNDRLEADELFAAASKPESSANKQGMKLWKDKTAKKNGVRYFNPGDVTRIKGIKGMRICVLGPPRDEDLLDDEDPVGPQGFPRGKNALGLTFLAAAQSHGTNPPTLAVPFRRQFRIPKDESGAHEFLSSRYGEGPSTPAIDGTEVPEDADWRRIDEEWLYSAEDLALKMNKGINNTSLVLAFELPKTKKVLFFAGDAQKGNWISWDKCKDGDEVVTARDLLERTVLYKVAHHGSHNATLAGTIKDTYPNLSWMAKGDAAHEFTAMITCVNKWAIKQTPPWVHPLPSIEKALNEKAQGRVFRTDRDEPEKPPDVSQEVWAAFHQRATFDKLFFDYLVFDH
jgi:beta-lactamase superfamily II metal-dependent hydrolase